MAETIDIRELNERIERQSAFVTNLTTGMDQVIVGQKHLVESLLWLFSGVVVWLPCFVAHHSRHHGAFCCLASASGIEAVAESAVHVVSTLSVVWFETLDYCSVLRHKLFVLNELSLD